MKENKFVIWLAGFVTHRPWLTLLLSLIAISISAAGIQHLGFKNDYRVYFSEDNPQLQAFETIQNTYNKSDNVIFIVEPKDGGMFNREMLDVIKTLTDKAWQLPYSIRVDSITNFQHTVANQDELVVADLVKSPTRLRATDIKIIRSVALKEPLLVNRLISDTGHVAGVNVTFQLPQENASESMLVADQARQLISDVEALYPGIKIYVSGMVMMNNAFAESSIHDNTTLVPLMYGIVILVMWLSLRSISATFSIVILIVCSIVSAMGIAAWSGMFLTPTSAIAPTIILTMAVADCVHLLVTMLHNMRIGHEKRQALRESLRINFQPILLTSVTTAIGFLSMNFSDAPPFRDLGNVVALGVMIAFLLTITLLPALMALLPVKVKPQTQDQSDRMLRLAEYVIAKKNALLIFIGLLAVVFITLSPLNELNDEYVKYFDQTTEFRQGTDFLNENMSGLYNIEISLSSANEGGVNEPDFLNGLDRFTTWLNEQPEVLHVNVITDTYKRLNKNMHADQSKWYRLPDSRELAAQYLLLYEMSLPYGLDLNDQININKSATRVIVTLETMSSNRMLAVESKINQWLANQLPDFKSQAASPVLMFSHIGKRNIVSMIAGTLLALVMISVLLLLAFRSIKLGLISLVPNLVPAGVAFGIWALVDAQIGLGLSVVTGLTLGIVVDDTVHFISKYRRARLEKGLNSEDAVRYAFSTVGSALWITSVVLVSGFLILSFSHFSMNADMGLMTAITIAVALFMDFLLLPPLLMVLEKK